MRYLVTARVKPGHEDALREAIEGRTLGKGSVAGDEYLRNMSNARWYSDGRVKWVEICSVENSTASMVPASTWGAATIMCEDQQITAARSCFCLCDGKVRAAPLFSSL